MSFRPAIKVSTDKLSSEYYRSTFKLIDHLIKPPEPLQFVNIWIPGIDEVPMSISDYDESSGLLTIMYRIVGEGTRSIRDLNGFFSVKGPLGRGFDPSRYDKILFISGGIGIAPLPYLAKVATLHGGSVDVIWGVKSSDLLFDLHRISRHVRRIYYATEDCIAGYCGTTIDLLKMIIDKREYYDVYVAVGPRVMLRETCRLLKGNYEVYVSLESYVKCGIGACGSCVLKPIPRLLCLHGPVFKCEEVEGYLEQG